MMLETWFLTQRPNTDWLVVFMSHLTAPGMGGWWRWALVSPNGVAPSQMVGVSAYVSLPVHHKVQKFSSGTGSPAQSRKKGRKMAVVVVWLTAPGTHTGHRPNKITTPTRWTRTSDISNNKPQRWQLHLTKRLSVQSSSVLSMSNWSQFG